MESGGGLGWSPPLVVLVLSTALNLWLASRFPLAPDETYYWQWSRHLRGGYYDQGPMVAWWIHASCRLWGQSPLGIRFGIVLASLATKLFIYLLARDLFGGRIALWTLVLSSITILTLVGGFVATYDPLMALFWAAALYFAGRALFAGSRAGWLAMGAAIGLGLLAKHTMALFIPCLALALVAIPDSRRWLRRPEPYLAALLVLVVVAPNLWWQAQNEWMTFRHLLILTGKGTDQSFGRRLGDFLGSQAGLLTPLLFLCLLFALGWAGRHGRRPGGERLWFLFAMSAPVLLFFLLMTAKAKVQANWAVAGWMTPPILYAVWLTDAAQPRGRRFGGIAVATCLFLATMLVWPEARHGLGIRIPQGWDAQMNKLYGGEQLAVVADRVRLEMEAATAGPVVPGSATYDTASRMAFYMRGQPETRCLFLGTRLNSYVQWNEEAPLRPGGNALIVDDRAADDPELPPFRAIFTRVDPLPQPVVVYRRPLYAEPVHRFYLYRCYGYRPDPLVERPSGG